jgi:hypothetical protein
MAHLIYYRNERENFNDAFEKKMSVREAEIVFAKLCRHFKISPKLEWTSGRNHPHACGSYLIRLNVDMNDFGCLCHELAHTLHLQKGLQNNENYHGKKHRRIMKRMVNYCKKKNWFAEELQRRTAPKPEKALPTKDEQRASRILSLENRRSEYERKIRLAENRIKKLNRQISALKRFL